MINVDLTSVVVYMACVFLLFIFGNIFIVPIKIILKLVINSILGGLTIFVINIIGSFFNFHIGINLVTSIFVGVLGIPGAIIIIIAKLLLN